MLVRYEPLAIPSAKSNRQPHVESLGLVSPSTVDRAVGVGDVFPGDNGQIAELPDALLSQPRKKRFERPPIVVDARPLLRGRDVVEYDVCVMVGDHLVDVSSADGVRPHQWFAEPAWSCSYVLLTVHNWPEARGRDSRQLRATPRWRADVRRVLALEFNRSPLPP